MIYESMFLQDSLSGVPLETDRKPDILSYEPQDILYSIRIVLVQVRNA